MRLLTDSKGQAAVLSVLFLVGLLGMAALVLDVGSWFRASRASQAAADASALAGAQALPSDPSSATNAALTWANKNGGGVSAADITISSQIAPNDTISVTVKRREPSFFAQLFGIGSADVASHAVARTDGIADARYVAPIAVPESNPELTGQLSGTQCPCFGPNAPTQLDLGKAGVPGAFHLIDFDNSNGVTGSSTLADWILHGFDAYLPLGGYFSDTGTMWNSSDIQSALTARIAGDLLFPVYDTIKGTGANAQYHVVGWVGFHLDSIDARGGGGTLYGYFDQVLWEGIQATTAGGGGPDFGVRSIQLVN
jgi:Flp pilus assembly protein TadG